MPQIRCTSCYSVFPEDQFPYRCPACQGIYDYDGPPVYQGRTISHDFPGIWAYRSSFSLSISSPVITLGEGNTPFIWTEYQGTPIGLKLEFLNPTGSYKDRGTAVLTSYLLNRGYHRALEDSSGNAGASFAAYAARAGISARIYIPESASGPKRIQIERFGAELIRVPGPRSAASEAVLKEVERGGVYASHAYMPMGLMGIATIAYELIDNLCVSYKYDSADKSGDIQGLPGTIVAPVGHGGLLLGIIRGFTALKQAGVIEELPCYVGVQSASCAPVVAASRFGIEAMEKIEERETIAEGVRVRKPVRVEALLKETEPQKRDFLQISDEKTIIAHQELARRGIQVEPTSALVWAALDQIIGRFPEPIVLILTGSGLKYQPGV